MSLYERAVTFDCGHRAARRVCKDGRSLLGDQLRCHSCGRDKLVVSETAPVPFEYDRGAQ